MSPPGDNKTIHDMIQIFLLLFIWSGLLKAISLIIYWPYVSFFLASAVLYIQKYNKFFEERWFFYHNILVETDKYNLTTLIFLFLSHSESWGRQPKVSEWTSKSPARGETEQQPNVSLWNVAREGKMGWSKLGSFSSSAIAVQKYQRKNRCSLCWCH